jgi:hypothetical protein
MHGVKKISINLNNQCWFAVLRIRDVYPGSDFFPSRIPDQNFSIPDPGSASKNLGILTQEKWFLSSRKYDPGCSSQIPDPWVKKAPDPEHWCCGSDMFIPDPNFSISRIQGHKNSVSRNRIRIKELRTLKTISKLGKISWDVHPGSQILIKIFSHPGSRSQKSTGCRITDLDSQQ